MSEPTEEMILAGIAAANRTMPYISDAQCVAEIWKAMQAARAALPKMPKAVEDAYQALQNELIQIQATIESFATPAAALSALIDWHVSVATDPRVNGGMALVPVVGKDSFVQLVPDHCDRIVWRGSYHHLPLAATKEKGE